MRGVQSSELHGKVQETGVVWISRPRLPFDVAIVGVKGDARKVDRNSFWDSFSSPGVAHDPQSVVRPSHDAHSVIDGTRC